MRANQDFTIEDFQSETWNPVVGYESIYAISSIGRLRRAVPNGPYANRIRIPQLNRRGRGYATIGLRDGRGGKRTFSIHSLVAAAFLGPRPADKDGVNHIDGDTQNNRIANLEYVTHRENVLHAHRLGLYKRGVEHARATLTQPQVDEIRYQFASGNLSITRLARIAGVDRRIISRCIQRIHY